MFQQEAGRTTDDEQLSFSDLAGEEPSNDATPGKTWSSWQRSA